MPSSTLLSQGIPEEFRALVEGAVGTAPATTRGSRTYSTVLAVAEEAFAAADYSRISIGSIASQAGVSVGSIYRYFDSKEGLFLVVLSRCLSEMYGATRTGRSSGATYREVLKNNTFAYLLAYHKYRYIMGAADQLGSTSQRVRDLNWELQRLIRGGMTNGLKRMQASSPLPPLPADIQIRALASMVDGYARRAFVDGEFGDREASVESIDAAAEVLSLVWYRSVLGDEASN